MNTNLKKLAALLFGGALCCSSVFALASCAEKPAQYTAASDFFWAPDKDKNYGNRTYDLEIGKSAYMLLKVKVISTGTTQDEIGAKLTIPYIQDVVSQYRKGQPITPDVDELNHTTTYNFTVIASQNPIDTELTFEFIPVVATDVTVTLEFDDKIYSSYDKQCTVSFVEPKNTPEESLTE